MMFPIFAVTTVLHFVTVDCKTAKSLLHILCSIVSHQVFFSAQQRQVNAKEKKIVQEHLILYYKSLVIELLNTTAHGDVKALTTLQFML